MNIVNSKSKNKRFTAVFTDGSRIDFGLKGGSTYIDHGDNIKRINYIKRHKVNENWNKINAGSLSRYILWGDSKDINVNIQDYKRRFNIK
jgi:hypothetical protein